MRSFLTSASFLMAGIVLGAVACGSKQAPGGLTVSGGAETPSSESAEGPSDEAKKGPVRVKLAFSRPMVATENVGTTVATPPVLVEPSFASAATWIDAQTLVLVPSSSLPPSTKFVVTVPGATRALDGSTLGRSATIEFSTDRIKLKSINVVGDDQRAQPEAQVKVSFNQDVEPAQLESHCRFSAEEGGDTKIKLAADNPQGPAESFTLVPQTALALNKAYEFVCRAGLRGAVGNLGTEEESTVDFRTYGALAFAGITPTGSDLVPDEDLRLDLAFSNPLAKPYQLKLSPPAPGFPQRCFDLGRDPAGLSCAPQLDARTAYTLTIGADQKDAFGQALGKEHVIEFRTSDAEPTVSVETGYYIAELKRPVIPVWTRNVDELQVSALRITPANFHKIADRIDWWESKPLDLEGTRLTAKTKTIKPAGEKNQWKEVALGGPELVGDAAGPGMYYVEIGSPQVKEGTLSEGGREKVLVNFTDIGVVSKLSPTQGTVWATQLSTGKPLPGATVTVRSSEGKVTFTGITDGDGLVTLPGRAKLEGKKPGSGEGGGEEEEHGGAEPRIYVAKDNDWTMINPTRTGGLAAWNYNVDVDYEGGPTRLRGFMHTDRGLYRPGDVVHVKGLARETKLGSPLGIPDVGKEVAVEVEGPTGKTMMTTEAKLSAFGGFWFDLELPADARLGDYQIRARFEHGTFHGAFSVEEYRAATFEVGGKMTTGELVRRGEVKAELTANYLYGAPLRGGKVAVAVHARPRRVAFEKFDDFSFLDERRYQRWYDESEHSQSLVTEDQLSLDGDGKAKLAFSVGADDISRDSDLLIRASVTSPGNEVISKTFTAPYFRSRRYFGIRSPGYFLDVKKPQTFQLVAVGANGAALEGPAKVTVSRRDWNCTWEDWGYRGSYRCDEKTEVLVEKTMQLAAGGPTPLEFTPPKGGEYWVVVEGASEKDEAAAAATNLYAWGDGGGEWRAGDSLQFEMVADKREYKPGDTATLLLKTDLAQATGLVTIERDGVIEQRLIEVTPTQKHITVPLTANYAPNVYVSVSLIQGRMGDGPRGRPRMRMGIVNLPVRPADNRLTVEVVTDKKDYRPGAPIAATVKVTDAAGKPVAAEVSISAADEGVLSLIGYKTPDPIPTFYAPWGLAVSSATQLEYLRDIPGPGLERPATGGDSLGTPRSRFVATAVWAPNAITNAAGVAKVQFNAPDNLTAFRVMAVAADKGERFGSADQRFTVSKPLQIHQALPRFINMGDKVLAGVTVHNETGAAGTAKVTVATDALIGVAGEKVRTVELPKGAAVPVLFELSAAQLGTASLTFSASLGKESDAMTVTLPVQHPSPLQLAHVGHAVTTKPVDVAVSLPKGAMAGAEVVVAVDPDGLAGLEEGLRDLIGYPYGCLEQTTSKVIPMIAVRDLADSLDLAGLSGKSIEAFVTAGIAKIGRHQTSGGGFSLWPGGEPEAYYTAYALWGLHLAKKAGYAVDDDRIADGLNYLRESGKEPNKDQPYYNEHGDLGSQAFALYVRAALGDKDPAAMTNIITRGAAVPVFGQAHLARALGIGLSPKDPAVAAIVKELANRAKSAGDELIREPDDANLGYYMSSPLRTTSSVLAALVELDPKNAAIPALVRSIMKGRRNDRWLDTQENLYSLLALSAYAKTVAGSPPSVTIDVGGKQMFAGVLSGKGRLRTVSVPAPSSGAAVRIVPRGEVHYSVDVRYRREVAALVGESNGGVAVRREYFDENGAAKKQFAVGDIVVVRVTADLPADSPHVMVSDPFPSGFEALNSRLATVGNAGVQETRSWRVYREMRDDRVDFSTEWNYRGTAVYEYSMRATRAGTFIRPPTVAQLMYDPGKSALTPADSLEVRAK